MNWLRDGSILWIMMIVSIIGVIGIIIFLSLRPVPARFVKVDMITPTVQPSQKHPGPSLNGIVRIKTIEFEEDSNIDPLCLVSTQYFVETSDGWTWKLPGERLANPKFRPIEEMYQAVIPYGATPGPAFFYIINTFGCQLYDQHEVTPKIPFTILPSEP